MSELKNVELMNVCGGGFNIGVAAGASALLAFIVGIFDGIVRPLKCR